MGKCVKCGVQYCDCPSDGICSNCQYPPIQRNENETGQRCEYSVETLQQWDAIISCAMNKELMDRKVLNVHLGYIRSELSITNSQCRFRKNLQEAELVVMNLLMMNSEC